MKDQIVVNNSLVNFYKTGEGEKTLIFLHGWRSSAQAWSKVIDMISGENLTIYALDLPGFGESPAPKNDFTVEDYAEILAGFAQKLNLKNTILVGHSFGGRVAIKLAAVHPGLIERLVLVDSAGLILKNQTLKRTIAKIIKPFFKFRPMQKIRREIYRRMGSEDYVATPGLEGTYLNVINEDLSKHLPEIHAPTLIIWGKDDKETTLTIADILNSQIIGSKLEVLANAGHFSFLDQPEMFVEALKKFIEA